MDGSSDSDEEFIHKYRQMRIPSMYGDGSYLATVRRFMNRNVEQKKDAGTYETSLLIVISVQ